MLQPNPERRLRLIPDFGSVLGQGLWVPEASFRPTPVSLGDKHGRRQAEDVPEPSGIRYQHDAGMVCLLCQFG
jgi:hypothetical protein